MAKSVHQIIQQYQDHVMDSETEKRLNRPMLKQDGFEKPHEDFLGVLVKKLESGELNPLRSASLFNRAVYDQLSEGEQEATDLAAINLMSVIRQIERLWQADHKQSYQLQNLVDTVFRMKSVFEKKHGDVFII